MPPWGAGPKPKKTPANTVRNSTYSTGQTDSVALLVRERLVVLLVVGERLRLAVPLWRRR